MTMGTDRTEPEATDALSDTPEDTPADPSRGTPAEPARRGRGPRRASRPATGSQDRATTVGAGPEAQPRGARPEVSVDDTDQGWGESGSDPSRDQWMRDQRPPHWGRD
jgi:hypothetical protein